VTSYLLGFVAGFGTCAVVFIVMALLASASKRRFPPVAQQKPNRSDYEEEDYG
jgi:hypothetical protein